MNALGIIFSDLKDWSMTELASHRSVAAIPYGGRYRLIDFPLSNFVNSGMNKMCIITNSNYKSLMEHIGSGKDWDLSRKKGGILILPPYVVGESYGLFHGRLDALKRTLEYISSSKEKYVILADADVIYNINFKEVIEYHEKKQADITALYSKIHIDKDSSIHKLIYEFDEDERAKDVLVYPITSGNYNVGLDAWIMDRDFLITIIYDAIARNYKDFSIDVLSRRVKSLKIYGYEYEGYYAHIDSLQSYYDNSMDLLKKENIESLFYSDIGPIYTKTKDSPPAKYCKDSKVNNSLIANGCKIEGRVENSIIFRNVKIGKGTVIKNSIIMQHGKIGENVKLDSIVMDTYGHVTDNKILLGNTNCPFFIKRYSII